MFLFHSISIQSEVLRAILFFREIAFSGGKRAEKPQNQWRKRMHRGSGSIQVHRLLKRELLVAVREFFVGASFVGGSLVVYQQTRAMSFSALNLFIPSTPGGFRKKNTNKKIPKTKTTQPPLRVSRGWHTVSNSSVTRGSRNELGISTNRSNLDDGRVASCCWSQGEPQRKTRKSNVVSFRTR